MSSFTMKVRVFIANKEVLILPRRYYRMED